MDSRGRSWMVAPNITLIPSLAQGGAQVHAELAHE
jgi:hypothetical protein